MLNGNGSLDTQTHKLIEAIVKDLPTPPAPPPITGMHEIQRPPEPRGQGRAGA